MHDYWMTLLCLFLGKVFYDNNPHIQYRQHGNNVVGAKEKRISTAVDHLKENQSGNRVAMVDDFLDTYDLQGVNSPLRSFAKYNNSKIERIVLMNPLYRGVSKKVTVGFKIRALMGRMY